MTSVTVQLIPRFFPHFLCIPNNLLPQYLPTKTVYKVPVPYLAHGNIRNHPLTPDLNPSEQHCLTRFFTGDFAS
jgi:hypothetical protein